MLEFFAQTAYVVPALPVVAFAIVIVFGDRAPGRGAGLPIAAMSVSTLWALGSLGYCLTGGEPFTAGFEWAHVGRSFFFSMTVDAPAAIMLSMVAVVALLVMIYSTGYMHDDPLYARFFAFLALFSSSMLGLVLSSNLILLFMCWELVGLMSYLLIGFWFHKPEAARACKKAFLTTRLGDVGFTIAIIALFVATRSLDLREIFTKVTAGEVSSPMLFLISLGLFAGAVGKSAQFPLHVWLPDAMEGPTPVSALIHAATMVAAGVWMIYRMQPVIQATAGNGPYDAMKWIAVIGGFTAVFAATIAIAQDDIKRVLAYSTISQLGYMMLGLGVGAFFAGFFHLLTHAFFKALLFLGSGSVIIGCHHEQDMKKMGGLMRTMPITFVTFAIGTLALMGLGIPGWYGFSGFHSKEMILVAAWLKTPVLAWLGIAGAFLTPFYMTRLICLTFFGKTRDRHVAEHAHETPPNMTVPLIVLSVFALAAGWFAHPFESWLDHGYAFHAETTAAAGAHHGEAAHGTDAGHGGRHDDAAHHAAEMTVGWIATGCVAAGIFLGVLLWGRGPERTRSMAARSAPLRGVRALLANKYYIDEFYLFLARIGIGLMIVVARFDLHVLDRIFVRGWAWLTLKLKSAAGWIDREIVDRVLVHAGPAAVFMLGGILQLLQTGSVHFYALITAMGGLVLVASALFVDGVLSIILTLVGLVAVAGVVGTALFRRQRKAVRQ
ncbi:MAG: NADH-quinone oxidoreductase subunit L [Armatimonadia bacterium]|nr:NADH-quinone oxidoreductase subunit L [Armatimonadia bacterium]